MGNQPINSLRDIGLQLDRDQYPRVYNGGIVKPGDAAIADSIPGEDTNHVYQRQRRPKTRPWERTAGWQGSTSQSGTTGRSGAASETPPFFGSSLRALYEAELEAVRTAYPNMAIWDRAEGLWLLTESAVLPGLGKKATFLTALPFSSRLMPRSWAFWTTPISWQWIGPRHTNFPDGSICAFDPVDRTWSPGESITQLIDLYTLWAFRHEHLRVFGRWPGRQSVPLAYERLDELQDDEYCGCNKSPKLYKDCCKTEDLSRPRAATFWEFFHHMRGYISRTPPEPIYNVIRTRCEPPPIIEILTRPHYQP